MALFDFLDNPENEGESPIQGLRTIVQDTIDTVDNTLLNIIDAGITSFISGAGSFFILILTLSLMGLGWAFYKNKITFDDFISISAVMLVTVSFYFALPYIVGFIQEVVFEWPSRFASLFIGSDASSVGERYSSGIVFGAYHAFDLMGSIASLGGFTSAAAWQKFVIGLFLLAATILFGVKVIALLLINRIRLIVLIMVMPLFLILFLMEKTRSMAEGYVQLILTSMVALFLLDIFAAIIVLTGLFASVGTSWGDQIVHLIVMFVMGALVSEVPAMAQSIGGGYLTGGNPLNMPKVPVPNNPNEVKK